jgi:PKD repeat protein
VEFQNLSINATTYSWNFGDPTSTTNTSTETNPTHIFNTNGTYTVTLIVGNGTSDSTFVSYLTVSDVPVAAFAYTPLIPVAGDTVNFQNLSLNATSYSWNFDDPTSETLNTSTDKNPSHLFSTSDAYFVKLTSTNTTASKSVTLIVLVTENTLGIDTNIKNEKIKIYPNPFSNYISISGENTDVEYELINLEGKTVYKANHIQNDFSNLSKGIYLLKVTDNNKTTTYKLVKH